MSRFAKVSLILSLLVAGGLLIVVACDAFGDGSSPDETPDGLPEGFETVLEVWNVLTQEFVEKDQLTPDLLKEGAIRGILDAIDDPYSAYLPPPSYRMHLDDLAGKFEGIGATVETRGGQIIVVAPIPGSPAEKAGIRPGDIILEADGQSLAGKSLPESVLLVRGPKGTTVSLLILHRGVEEPVRIEVIRDVIEDSTVTWRMLEGDIGLVRISSFAGITNGELREALEGIKKRNAQGLVVDIRNNGGGLRTAVIDVTSQFLTPDQGLVFYEIDGNGERKDWSIKPGGLATEIPMVVLVNAFSASASEVFTGALRAHGRATIVGVTTFGKGSENLVRGLNDGSGIVYTFARWLTPDDILIEGKGIVPDIVVEQPDDSPEDVQLQRAQELLRSQVAAAVP